MTVFLFSAITILMRSPTIIISNATLPSDSSIYIVLMTPIAYYLKKMLTTVHPVQLSAV
ncbi:hypothetical protein ACE1AT_04960 [Pelatocladus sp. BLCC-F211]